MIIKVLDNIRFEWKILLLFNVYKSIVYKFNGLFKMIV